MREAGYAVQMAERRQQLQQQAERRVDAGCDAGLDRTVENFREPSPGDEFGNDREPIFFIQGHFARRDSWVTPEKAEGIRAELARHGHAMELHMYDADHAFANDTRPEVHNPEATRLAWQRMTEFFRKHLG